MDKNSCGCGSKEKSLLERLRELDFAIVEVTLYLDVYPACREASEYLINMREKRARLASEYEEKHGMLTMYGVCGDSSEGHTPWPWEYAAN